MEFVNVLFGCGVSAVLVVCAFQHWTYIVHSSYFYDGVESTSKRIFTVVGLKDRKYNGCIAKCIQPGT